MITGTQKDIDRLLPFMTGRVKKALEAVRDLDLDAIATGKTPIDGDNIFASVNEYETEPFDARRPEKHECYIDIQIVAEGRETIGATDVENVSDMTEDRRQKDDVSFYGKTTKENTITLEKGDFVIFFPWEVHRPNCEADGKPEHVKKIVVKVRME
jgi:biofilm protein TabA